MSKFFNFFFKDFKIFFFWQISKLKAVKGLGRLYSKKFLIGDSMAAYWPLPDRDPQDWSADAERCCMLIMPSVLFAGDTFESIK